MEESERAKRGVGVLTTLDRGRWGLVRESLLKQSDHNKAALEIVDSALFVLVLDDFAPSDIHEAAANCLHGSYKLAADKNEDIYQVSAMWKERGV